MTWKYYVIVCVSLFARALVQVASEVESKSTLYVTATKSNWVLIWIHMLLSLAGPREYLGVVLVFKSEEQILAVSKETEVVSPRLQTEASELPAVVVLNDQYGGVPITTLLEEGYRTTPILVHIEYALPLTLPIKWGESSYQVADLKVA